MWANVKLYAYGAVMFIISALGVWVKILSEQKESLEKDNLAKDKELEQSSEHTEEVNEAREEEQKQSSISTDGEEAKDNVSEKVEKQIEESNINDVKVSL